MSVSGSSSSGPPLVDYGLISGLNTQQIIQALLQPYLAPVQDLQSQQSNLASEVGDYQQINSDLSALQTAAQALSTSSGWQAMTASSSDSSVATATAGAGTPAGSVSFTVNQLAAADTLVSSGSVAATSDVVTTSPDFLLSQGAAALGFSSLASSGLSLGQHTVDVTQASAAASTTGTTALAGSTTITSGSNDTLSVTVDGTAYTYTIAAGTYTPTQLASAVATASGGTLVASVNASGDLVLSTADQGSAHSLQVTGGTALGSLGLQTMSSAVTGTNAVVSVDGTSTTVSSVIAGQSLSLASGSGGSVIAVVGSAAHLAVGSLSATDVSTGSGSLASVVSSINAANTGITAAAVQTSSGAYVLQLSSNTTGTASDLSVDPNAFSSSGLGTLQTAVAGADALVTVGGSGGYQVSSQTDTVTGLLPGLTVNLQGVSSTAVTVTVAPDASTEAGKVSDLVKAANTVLADIQKYAGYDQATKTGGPLMGSPVLTGLQNQILSIFGVTSGTSTLANSEAVGITLTADGTINFDQTKFESAFSANPTAVSALFSQGGTFSPSSSAYAGEVSLDYASNTTRSGSYAVEVTHSATQATDNGSVLSSGTVSAAETLTVESGSATVSYSTQAGQSLASIAEGLNQAFAGAGLALSAQVVNSGQQLQITSAGYGSAASFQVSSNAATTAGTTGLAGTSANNTFVAFTGTDVAGTINGVAGTGTGQVLAAPTTDPTLGGLSLTISVPGITSATSLGTYNYSPGIAQALASVAAGASDPATGTISTTIKSLQQESTNLDPQISMYQSLAAQEQKVLQQEFANLETQLGTLKSQSSALQSALAGLPTL